jgi:hypothetical protein
MALEKAGAFVVKAVEPASESLNHPAMADQRVIAGCDNLLTSSTLKIATQARRLHQVHQLPPSS